MMLSATNVITLLMLGICVKQYMAVSNPNEDVYDYVYDYISDALSYDTTDAKKTTPGPTTTPQERSTTPRPDCIGNKIPVTIVVRVEHSQQAVSSDYKYSEITRSSSNFKKSYNEVDLSYSAGAGYAGFSATASTSVRHVTDEVSKTTENFNTKNGEAKTYNTNELQIKRKITTTVDVNGESASVETERYVDSVPINNRNSQEQLSKRGELYIRNTFGHEKGTITGSAKNIYTETACVQKQKKRGFRIDVVIGMVKGKTLSLEEEYGEYNINWKQGSFLGLGGDRKQTYWNTIYSLSPGAEVRVFKQKSLGPPSKSIKITSEYQYGKVNGKLILVHHDKEQTPYQGRFCFECTVDWSDGEYLKDVY